MLARAGMTGPETSLEGRYGLFRQFAGDESAAGHFSLSIKDIGKTWHLPQAAFKFYPCCHYLHPFIEAAEMLAARGVAAGDVLRIVCSVPPGAAPIVCEPWKRKQAPETAHAARWSLPIVVAARLVDGKVDLGTFERSASRQTLALARLIEWTPLQNARFPERFEAEIECTTRSGASHAIRVDDVYGNQSRPAGTEAVLAKFHANAARSLVPGASEALAQAVEALDRGADLAKLGRALRQIMPHEIKKEARAK
jgi:2-methylcitrate dehydratase PrpD